MNAEVVEFEAIRDIDAIRALQPDWDALWHRAQGECYQTFTFCLGSWDTGVSTPGGNIHCIAGRKDGRLVALLPFVTRWNLLWKFVRPLAPETGTPHGILVEPGPDAAEIANAAWRALLKSTRADAVELRRVHRGSMLHLSATTAGRIMNSVEETTPFAPLRQFSDWDEFRRSRTGRSRTPPEYIYRRLESTGRVEVMILDTGDDRIEYFIDWLILHKREWALRMNLDSRSIFADETRKFLLAQLSPPVACAQPFRLFVLTVDDKPLAIALLSVTDTCVDLFMNTYDASYAKLSPGTVLIDYCVKWAFQNRLDFDFGSGVQQYKHYWSQGTSYDTVSLRLAQTRWGLVGCTLKDTFTRARERVKRLRSGEVEARFQ